MYQAACARIELLLAVEGCAHHRRGTEVLVCGVVRSDDDRGHSGRHRGPKTNLGILHRQRTLRGKSSSSSARMYTSGSGFSLLTSSPVTTVSTTPYRAMCAVRG